MAKPVLLVHGGGEGAYAADAKLAGSLRAELGPDYEVRYPEMPNEDEPDYETWKGVILQYARDMGEDAILVGHSIGASVLIKVFAETGPKPEVAGMFLVSGPFWYEHDFWRWDEVKLPADAAQHVPDGMPVFFYHGEDDEFVPVAHVDMYAAALPRAHLRRLPGRNHQLNDDMSDVARDIESVARV